MVLEANGEYGGTFKVIAGINVRGPGIKQKIAPATPFDMVRSGTVLGRTVLALKVQTLVEGV